MAGIGLASFLSDVGHKVPTALLPSFLTSTLKAPASALGLIEGISDALAGVVRFGGGALTDDPSRRRRIAVGGYASTAVLSSAIGAAIAPWQASVFRAAAWTARGLRVPAVTRRWPTWYPRRSTAGPTGSSGQWTTWALSPGRCWLSA